VNHPVYIGIVIFMSGQSTRLRINEFYIYVNLMMYVILLQFKPNNVCI